MKTTKVNYAANIWQRYAVLIVTLLIIAFSPAYAEQLTSGVSFAQVSFTGSNPPEKYSHYGQISVDYTMLYGEGYVNVERYENGKAAGWVVKNLPVVSGSVLAGFSTTFDLGASGYQSSFTAYVDYSTTPLADDSSLKDGAPLTFALGQAEYPLSAPTSSESGADGRILQSLQTEAPAPDPADLTVAFLKTTKGFTTKIFWFNPDKAGQAPKHIEFTVKADASRKDVAAAIAAAMTAYFKANDLNYTAMANGPTVTVSGGMWAAVTNAFVALTVD